MAELKNGMGDAASGKDAQSCCDRQCPDTQQNGRAGIGVNLLHEVCFWHDHHNQPINAALIGKLGNLHKLLLPLCCEIKLSMVWQVV